MEWLLELFRGETVATSVLLLALVATMGVALGSIRIRGISLGVAGVLFAGLLLSYFGLHIEEHVLEFSREFGLILFVYSIGIQVGPGFISSLRREGLPLNIMAAAIVILGALLALGISYFADVPIPVAVGLFSGGTTNTPSLAAAQSALQDVLGSSPNFAEVSKLPGVGYAVAYPFGILGIILTMLLVRIIFRINVNHEVETIFAQRRGEKPELARMSIEVQNPNLEGMMIKNIPVLNTPGAVISRYMHDGEVSVAKPDTVVALGDTILAVGSPAKLEEVRLVVGAESCNNLLNVPSKISSRRMLVTNKRVMGKSIDELNFLQRYGVNITRFRRAGMELTTTAGARFHFGDSVFAVGESKDLDAVAEEIGDSLKKLDHPEVLPLFLGIILGVIVGSWPISIPGIPAPVKLGLAGGPLIVAIILSRIGQIRGLTWYLPMSANFMLRELGIILFLACVGLKSGDRFVQVITEGQGLYWMGMAAIITLVPILLVSLVGRIFLKMNYATLCGLLAGSMTDPPALAFACTATSSDAPTVSYATVYPLTMILRVLCAQLLVLLFMS